MYVNYVFRQVDTVGIYTTIQLASSVIMGIFLYTIYTKASEAVECWEAKVCFCGHFMGSTYIKYIPVQHIAPSPVSRFRRLCHFINATSCPLVQLRSLQSIANSGATCRNILQQQQPRPPLDVISWWAGV